MSKNPRLLCTFVYDRELGVHAYMKSFFVFRVFLDSRLAFAYHLLADAQLKAI